MPRRPRAVGPDEAALVHRRAERRQGGRRRVHGGTREPLRHAPQRTRHVLRLDGTKPRHDLLRRGTTRPDEAAVPQPGVRDRAVRHGPSLGREPTRTRHDRAADDYDDAVSREPAGWDVDSPVQAEIFVVWLDGDRLQLTGPDGPQPWVIQLGA